MEGSYQGVAQGYLIKINSIEPFALIKLYLACLCSSVSDCLRIQSRSLLLLNFSSRASSLSSLVAIFSRLFAMRLFDAHTYHFPLHSRWPSTYVTLVHTITIAFSSLQSSYT